MVIKPEHFKLPDRWYPLRYHEQQFRLWNSRARFNVVAAGRRSGKTERAKRKLVRAAISFSRFSNGKFIAAAPTRDQAREIYWDDLKQLSPPELIADISESHLYIEYINGARLYVIGMDKPHRAEGTAIDGAVLDEYADMKATAWKNSIRPSLSTMGRLGWAWFIGRPRGRNHFYDIFQNYLTKRNWASFTWHSATVIDAAEVAEAKEDLDERTYNQEYGAEFLDFAGRIYYPFGSTTHCDKEVEYNPALPLFLCFDFNIEPGVCGIVQEPMYTGRLANVDREKPISAVVSEVHIKQNSNTVRVCRKIREDWGHHPGDVFLEGDATGASGGSAKVRGSDWDIILQELRPVFGNRLKLRVPAENPRERVRVNAVNSRLQSADGTIRLVVNPVKAPYTVKDFEGVTAIEGTNGEIDKDSAPELTHLTDGIGYHVVRRYPIGAHTTSTTSF